MQSAQYEPAHLFQLEKETFPTSFNLFTQDNYPLIQQTNKHASNREINAVLGKVWGMLPKEVHKLYKEKSATILRKAGRTKRRRGTKDLSRIDFSAVATEHAESNSDVKIQNIDINYNKTNVSPSEAPNIAFRPIAPRPSKSVSNSWTKPTKDANTSTEFLKQEQEETHKHESKDKTVYITEKCTDIKLLRTMLNVLLHSLQLCDNCFKNNPEFVEALKRLQNNRLILPRGQVPRLSRCKKFPYMQKRQKSQAKNKKGCDCDCQVEDAPSVSGLAFVVDKIQDEKRENDNKVKFMGSGRHSRKKYNSHIIHIGNTTFQKQSKRSNIEEKDEEEDVTQIVERILNGEQPYATTQEAVRKEAKRIQNKKKIYSQETKANFNSSGITQSKKKTHLANDTEQIHTNKSFNSPLCNNSATKLPCRSSAQGQQQEPAQFDGSTREITMRSLLNTGSSPQNYTTAHTQRHYEEGVYNHCRLNSNQTSQALFHSQNFTTGVSGCKRNKLLTSANGCQTTKQVSDTPTIHQNTTDTDGPLVIDSLDIRTHRTSNHVNYLTEILGEYKSADAKEVLPQCAHSTNTTARGSSYHHAYFDDSNTGELRQNKRGYIRGTLEDYDFRYLQENNGITNPQSNTLREQCKVSQKLGERHEELTVKEEKIQDSWSGHYNSEKLSGLRTQPELSTPPSFNALEQGRHAFRTNQFVPPMQTQLGGFNTHWASKTEQQICQQNEWKLWSTNLVNPNNTSHCVSTNQITGPAWPVATVNCEPADPQDILMIDFSETDSLDELFCIDE